jgi:hypothetical protein
MSGEAYSGPIAPKDPLVSARLRYRPGTLVLETESKPRSAPPYASRCDGPHVVRIVTGRLIAVLSLQSSFLFKACQIGAEPWAIALRRALVNRIDPCLRRHCVLLSGVSICTLLAV